MEEVVEILERRDRFISIIIQPANAAHNPNRPVEFLDAHSAAQSHCDARDGVHFVPEINYAWLDIQSTVNQSDIP